MIDRHITFVYSWQTIWLIYDKTSSMTQTKSYLFYRVIQWMMNVINRLQQLHFVDNMGRTMNGPTWATNAYVPLVCQQTSATDRRLVFVTFQRLFWEPTFRTLTARSYFLCTHLLELSLLAPFSAGYESSREQKFQEAKVPENKSPREQKFLSTALDRENNISCPMSSGVKPSSLQFYASKC